MKKVLVLGSAGMVGGAIFKHLDKAGWEVVHGRRHYEVDLMSKYDTFRFINQVQPDAVVLAAAKVGGIMAVKTSPAIFVYENLSIQLNAIEASRQSGVKRLLFISSSCVYPPTAGRPIKEESLLSGPFESISEPYDISKAAGTRMCDWYSKQYGVNYTTAVACNLYGPGDNYGTVNSHLIPALIRKFHEAKVSGIDPILWGTGNAYREALFVDDFASACTILLNTPGCPNVLNIGYGQEFKIHDIAYEVAKAVGYTGSIAWDSSFPDGVDGKLMDSSKMRGLGWSPKYSLQVGLEVAYRHFLEDLKMGTLKTK